MFNRNSAALVSIALAACLATAMAGAAELPAPTGRYAVGQARAEFVDASRTLDAEDPASGARRLPATVWYPASGRAPAGRSAYLRPEATTVTLPALARLFGYPPGDLQALATATVPVQPGARPARASAGFPVVVFSHGLFLYPEQNTAVAMQLASHGYIVVSIAHPGDAADLRLQDGRVVPTRPLGPGDDPRFAEAWKILAAGPDLAARRRALASYALAQPGTRIGRAAAQWREDAVFVAGAINASEEPPPLRAILDTADRARLAFVGMSMGGAAAAAACREVRSCLAAANLDGQNIDADLYDQPVRRPLLLLLSDWPRYGLLPPQPKDPDFSPNDLAYERWSAAGADEDVLRLRLQGARHLGFTDLGVLMEGPGRAERFGDIAGGDAAAAVDDVLLAFLDAHLRGGRPAAVAQAIDRHPAWVRHVPVRVQRWSEQERLGSP